MTGILFRQRINRAEYAVLKVKPLDGMDMGAIAARRWTLAHVFKTAEVHNGDARRFRDTFAVELLLSGVPLERVSVLLGHSSVEATERHYAPWVREQQEQMEADVRPAWEHDLILNPTISVQP